MVFPLAINDFLQSTANTGEYRRTQYLLVWLLDKLFFVFLQVYLLAVNEPLEEAGEAFVYNFNGPSSSLLQRYLFVALLHLRSIVRLHLVPQGLKYLEEVHLVEVLTHNGFVDLPE